jgi:hypothetical protein
MFLTNWDRFSLPEILLFLNTVKVKKLTNKRQRCQLLSHGFYLGINQLSSFITGQQIIHKDRFPDPILTQPTTQIHRSHHQEASRVGFQTFDADISGRINKRKQKKTERSITAHR